MLSQAAVCAGADKVVLVAGGGVGRDGAPAIRAQLDSPFGVAHDLQGRLLIVEYSSAVRAIEQHGQLVTIAGDGTKGDAGDNGPATAARLNSPHALTVGGDGTIYVADSLNHRIRRIDPTTNVISTCAGTTRGYSGDGGPAAKAQFSGIYCITLNPAKTRMVVTDLDNRRIRVIDLKTGRVELVAGNGKKGMPPDGVLAVGAPLVDPRAAAMDSKGNVYILERGGDALRVVDPAGRITTLIAGPKEARGEKVLAGPKHLCIDRDDNVIIADTDHHRIVKWDVAAGKLLPVAGTGTKGTAGVGGPPDKLQLNQPHGVYLDEQGALYIADSMNNRVLKIEQGG
jgi:DNA-binding beta-propeller fold protein YncE